MPFWRRRREEEPPKDGPASGDTPGTPWLVLPEEPSGTEPAEHAEPAESEALVEPEVLVESEASAEPEAPSDPEARSDPEVLVQAAGLAGREAPAEPRAPAEPLVPAEQKAPAEPVVSAPLTEPVVAVEPRTESAAPVGRVTGAAAPPEVPAFDPTAFLAVAPAHTLDQGLERTRTGFMTQLRGLLGGDDPQWDDVEELLIGGDVGAALAIDLVDRARRRRDPGGPEAAIRAELAALLVKRDLEWSPQPSPSGGPAAVLVVGVNGTGKTTTIGKLAARYVAEGRSVILAAADTFRAAAIDQLRIWADRAGVPVVAHAPGADPGAVVFDALDAGVARRADIVIADTAGRLHTKSNLMDELTKVRRIVDKRLPGAQPETLFVLDATTGQNGLTQAKAFHDAVGLTGIVLTKLDSTSKGGIVFAIEHALGVPVRFVGVGEGVNDLLVFDPDAFVEALFA
jgi:fused signal recognition particle receptor